MLLDARHVPDGQIIETDVCIIGAGAAGITLAREFRNKPFRTILLESGGLQPDAKTQSLYKGDIIGHDYYPLDGSRNRTFGGTTATWGGMCLPFDPIDFEQRDWVPKSGWPLDLQQLEPYYERAHEPLRIVHLSVTESFSRTGHLTHTDRPALNQASCPLTRVCSVLAPRTTVMVQRLH